MKVCLLFKNHPLQTQNTYLTHKYRLILFFNLLNLRHQLLHHHLPLLFPQMLSPPPPPPVPIPQQNTSTIQPLEVTTAPTTPSLPQSQPPAPEQLRIHTRSQSGITKKKQILSLHTDIIFPLPLSHVQATKDPNWNPVIKDEYGSLIDRGTWTIVPRPPNVNVVRSMWLFRHKFDAGGRLSRYKACLVANGKSQHIGIDCDEIFSPVVKPKIICTVLHLALLL